MCVALRAGRQWAHQVHLKVGETALRDGDGLDRSCGLCGDLGPLALCTFTAPAADIGGHALPHKPGRHQPFGGPDSRVGKCMDCQENSPLPGYRNQWPAAACRDITPQFCWPTGEVCSCRDVLLRSCCMTGHIVCSLAINCRSTPSAAVAAATR